MYFVRLCANLTHSNPFEEQQTGLAYYFLGTKYGVWIRQIILLCL